MVPATKILFLVDYPTVLYRKYPVHNGEIAKKKMRV
nr:MAG TPA: hypothetical protein [Caudoviricetes sp.]